MTAFADVKECRWINQKVCHDDFKGSHPRRTWGKDSLENVLKPIANLFKPILDHIGILLNPNKQPKCNVVPKKQCWEVPRRYCQPVSKQLCEQVPRTECKQVVGKHE